MSGIVWAKSWWMSAEQVATLGAEGISVYEITMTAGEEE